MSVTLFNRDNVTDDATLELDGAVSVTTAVVGGKTYLFVASLNDDGVSVFEVELPNTAPVLTGDLASTVNEGGSVVIGAADLGFTDPDDNAAGVTRMSIQRSRAPSTAS